MTLKILMVIQQSLAMILWWQCCYRMINTRQSNPLRKKKKIKSKFTVARGVLNWIKVLVCWWHPAVVSSFGYWIPFMCHLRLSVWQIDLGLKIFRLRFSFWPHMLLSWVPVIILRALIIVAMKLAYGPVHHGYIKNHI